MINLMLNAIAALTALIGGHHAPSTDAIAPPPPIAAQGDDCTGDEMRIALDDATTLCIHSEGDGMRIIIRFD